MPRRLPPAFQVVAGACVAQWAQLVAAVEAAGDDAFVARTRIGWTVAELVAHLAGTAEAVSRALAASGPGRADLNVLTYYAAARTQAAAVDTRARSAAAGRSPAQLRAALAGAVRQAMADLTKRDGRTVVAARLGSIRLGEFVETRCVEGVVHGLDLPGDLRVDPDTEALRVTVRLLADILAERAPGRSVEVRVPPYVVVQCGEGPAAAGPGGGPSHTRGTPPNVVEAPALVFVDLACGRLGWSEATRAGLAASGARADLTAWLPLV